MTAALLSEPTPPSIVIRSPDTRHHSPNASRHALPAPEPGDRLRVVFVGHVDHGKSTLIGRILHDTHSFHDGKLEQLQAACREEGMEFEYAFLLDALLEEQAQNITIDTTQIQFKTAKRPYVIIDAPGHTEFLKNMISGAASADAAVLLIAANEGVREQSRRHGYLLSLLGIRQVIVAVNKMDTVDYSETVFRDLQDEYTKFLHQIGLEARLFIPVSARKGDNIAARNADTMGWYTGPSIVDALDLFEPPKSLHEQPLRFPIQDVYRFDERRILAGRIESGTLRVGDKLIFAPGNKPAVVNSIERWSAPDSDAAVAGESIAITLAEQIFVERGHVASHEKDAPIETTRFKARLFWMSRNRLLQGRRCKLRVATQEVIAEIVAVERVIDATTLETIPTRDFISANDVAEVIIQTRSPLVLDNHDRNAVFGRFVIMDGHQVGGGGIVFGGVYTDRSSLKSNNIHWSAGDLSAELRAARNGHRGGIVWLTGLSGSGKSTIARALERELFNRSIRSYVLDGDNIRHGLSSNLGFSPEDRVENIRRVAEVARLMADAGLVVITAFISPYRADRELARTIALASGVDFMEIFVDTPLEVCEQRDPKHLYRQARAGQIANFTGIDAPYEAPAKPDLAIPTHHQTLNESVTQILDFVCPRLRFEREEPFEI